MDSLLTIFSLALLGIILMISHKMFEMKTGKSILFADLRKKADVVAEEWHGSLLEKIEFFTKENAKTLGRLLYVIGWRVARSIRRRGSALYARFHHEMKERAVLKSESEPSFFLKNVSEYKDKPVQ